MECDTMQYVTKDTNIVKETKASVFWAEHKAAWKKRFSRQRREVRNKYCDETKGD